MRIRLTCSCDKTLEVGPEFKGNAIICQNCGAKFPDGITAAVKKIFSGYQELCASYDELDGQNFEIIPESDGGEDD